MNVLTPKGASRMHRETTTFQKPSDKRAFVALIFFQSLISPSFPTYRGFSQRRETSGENRPAELRDMFMGTFSPGLRRGAFPKLLNGISKSLPQRFRGCFWCSCSSCCWAVVRGNSACIHFDYSAPF